MNDGSRKASTAIRLYVALVLAVGLAVAGYLAGRGVVQARFAERTVTVKGVAEAQVEAGLATLPLSFTVSGAEPTALKAGIDRQSALVNEFLRDFGFKPEDISAGRIDVQDAASYGYQPEAADSATRFTLANNVTVRSTDIDRVAALAERVGDLIQQGVAVNTSGARLGPIRHANQGVMSVLARDESPDASEWQSRAKRLRAVATVEYQLID